MSYVRLGAVALTAMALIGIAGCKAGGTDAKSAGGSPSVVPSVSEGPSSTSAPTGGETPATVMPTPIAPPVATPTTSATSTSSGAGSVPVSRCRTSQLHAAVTGYEGGAGSRFARLVFTNVSSRSCWMYGWPELGLGIQNEGFGTITVPQGPASTVTVVPGGKAHTRLRWSAIPADDENPGACQPTATVLRVTPYSGAFPLVAAWNGGPACQHNRMETTAVASGTGF